MNEVAEHRSYRAYLNAFAYPHGCVRCTAWHKHLLSYGVAGDDHRELVGACFVQHLDSARWLMAAAQTVITDVW